MTGAITFHGIAGAPYGGHSIVGNIIESSATMGIELQTDCNGCTVSGNVVRGCATGISIADSDKMSVTGNAVSGSTNYGIEVAGADTVSVSGNMVSPTSGSGIGIISSSVNVSVSGGSIVGGGYGMQINSGKCVVDGVTFRETTSSSIYIHDALNVSITGCQFINAGTADSFISFDATDNAISKFLIIGNRFSGSTTNNCISFYTPNGYVISDVLIAHNNTAGCTFGASAYASGSSINRDTSLLRIRALDNIGTGGDWAAEYNKDLNAHTWVRSSDVTAYDDYFAWDRALIKIDASGGARGFRLPNAAGLAGYQISFVKSDSSGNAVTINVYSTQTINGSSTFTLASQYKRATIRSDGTNWFVVESN